MADVTGSVTVKGLTSGLVYLYEQGKTYNQSLARFGSRSKTPEQLLPGTYVLGTRKQVLGTIELKIGEALTVDLSN